MCQTSRQLSKDENNLLKRIDPVEVVSLLQEIIKQRSDYPPGDCRIALQVIMQKLDQEAIQYTVYSRREHQPSLVVCLGGSEKPVELMFHAHIDTVPAGDEERWSVSPFEARIRENRIYGRGAGDDKSSVVAQIMAMIILARAQVNLQGNLKVVIVSDEESGGEYGTRWLHQEGLLETRALVVGEQTNNQVAIAERVACGIDMTVYGKSAHGAMPWAGENAILKMSRVLTWLQEHYFPILEQRKHPYLPPPTLNIGRIQGGIQWSIVAEQCKVEMDRRLIPGETREQALDELRFALENYSNSVEPLKFKLFSQGDVAANINTEATHPFVLSANQALEDLTGEKQALTGYVQTSDGRWFAKDGIPIILFGPSDPAVAHSTDEFVTIDQLVEATCFYTLLAYRILGGNGS